MFKFKFKKSKNESEPKKKKPARAPKIRQLVFFEVLQNGRSLDDCSHYFGRPRRITIGSQKGTLILPFYPLAKNIHIATFTRKSVRIHLDSTWQAFGTRKGQPVEVGLGRREDITLALFPGDFASISKQDLKILVKISPEKKVEKTPRDKKYRGKVLPLIISSRIEGQVLIASALLAAMVLSGLFGGLLARKDSRPQLKEDLKSEYNLAFSHPDHIRNLPEALQSNLNRKRPLASAIRFYEDVTKTFLGYKAKPSKYVFKGTTILYRGYYDRFQQKIDDAIETQRAADDASLQKPGAALVAIPAVTGETLGGGLIRLTQKIKMMHETYEKILTMRRATTREYKTDHGYDFETYQGALGKLPGEESAISQIKVFKMLTNEEAMYQEVKDLATLAAAEQKQIRSSREKVIPLSPENTAPLGIPVGNDFVSFTPENQFSDNAKLAQIAASTFGEKKEELREPLIGEISPSLIERVIDRNKFELQLCFELALRKNRALSGQMEWYWRLDTLGKISDLRLVTSSIEDRGMTRCVGQKIANWKFPKPNRGSVEITYPFVFLPAKG